MIPIYAICVVLGAVAGLAWVFLGSIAGSVAGKEGLDPELRYGETGRALVAGVLGFGLGGMSASFGGWNPGLALAGAFGGSLLMILAARFLGTESVTDEEDS